MIDCFQENTILNILNEDWIEVSNIPFLFLSQHRHVIYYLDKE